MTEWPFEEHFDILSSMKENKPLQKSDIDIKSNEIQVSSLLYFAAIC